MDTESSSKFIGSLSKFLQSLCNGYVDFDDGVELIGHIYLSVDGGKTGRKLNYFLNEKVCKNDNSVTFISNSFHAQPESKGKGKEGDGRKDDEAGDASESVPKSTNVGTLPSRAQLSRSATSPNAHRAGNQAGSKRPGSPLSAPTPPSQRRMQSSTVKGSVGSPAKIVPSSPSSSSQDNVPSPSPARKNKSEISRPASNQSDNASADNESDIVPPNVMAINPPPDFASFLGSLTGDNQSSRDQRSPPDIKPETDNDTDVTFIKEEFVSEPSSCAQAGSGGQAGGSGDDLYPVMLHQNSSVFPSTSAGYPPSTATSQHPAFHGPSTSQSHLFQAGSSQDGTDPSVYFGDPWLLSAVGNESCGEPAKSIKTKESTRYAVNIFQEYLQARGKSTNFEGMKVEDLNLCLADFFSNVRSRHGEVYSKNSLMAIRQGIRRYLQNAPFFRDFDIVTDARFFDANTAIKAAMRLSEMFRVQSTLPRPVVSESSTVALEMKGYDMASRNNK